MAIRNLRFNDDEILRKKCRVVDDINDRIKVLVEDMIETMYENNGVGLAKTTSWNTKEDLCC